MAASHRMKTRRLLHFALRAPVETTGFLTQRRVLPALHWPALAKPYEERPGLEAYAEPPPADQGTYKTFCGT